MKLGVITNGISRDLEYALQAMTKAGLKYAELQFLWDKEIGGQTPEEIEKIKRLVAQYQVEISCVSRHNFAGLPVMEIEPEDAIYQEQMAGLQRCIHISQALETNLVRIMSCRKEMIIFGANGAEEWVASTGTWDKLLKLMEAPVKLAEEEGITLVVETGNSAMITSGVLAKKLIDDLGSKHLKILWDIPNTIYCTEVPYPDAYEQIKDDIGHIHLKDCQVDISRATVRFCRLGEGDVAPYLEGVTHALLRDNYQGVSLSKVSIDQMTGRLKMDFGNVCRNSNGCSKVSEMTM